ncbi:proto-oncogene tyrosine-protein kinase ROS isoform X2 [Neocloeon triangulifer]|uniref:proto-oncogene tyrosine-protein kinase ROS isoform X2 n=1 Tax=Neocloeon triangulifer TaxID=2078957 RepID=UPI00286F4145|nr:proto-oncogene tyrosine-protein kinase ROS isoform X2 [Neocloeon triangulifer]
MAELWRLMSSLLLLLWTFFTCHGIIIERAISESCILHFQQNESGVTTDAECGDLCYDNEIKRGCSAWTQAKRSGCRPACHGIQDLSPPRELFCVMSCNYALNQYVQHLKDELGYPSTPALVADSLDSTSLSLEWNGVGEADTLYGIQWKYEEVPSSRWTYCCNQTMLPGTTRKIDNLVPYTKYRFRVAALVSNHSVSPQMVQFSDPSVVIGTKAEGLPASAPQMDIPVVSAEEPKYYLWQKVPPGRDYSISVAARNWEGEGPASLSYVSTPEEPEVFSDENAQVLLCTEDIIYRLELDIVGDITEVYRSNSELLGCAVHLRYKYIFFSDTSGSVFRIPMNFSANPELVIDKSVLGFEPLSLSVDWLNDALYIVGEAADHSKWSISKCLLDGQGSTVTYAGLNSKPRQLQVDPYNGYIFWIKSNAQNEDSLYRLDLAEPSNGVKHGTKPEVIIENTMIGAYTIDHTGLRLFVADEKQNTIFSVSLDGNEKSNIRQKTQEAEFKKVISLVAVNGLFFWTDGASIKGEEHNPVDKRYFHHIFPHVTQTSQFCMLSLSQSSQQTPVPVNPPNSLQAIFGHTTAKLAWQAPHLVAGQGKGAWQDWSYEVQVTNETDGSSSTIRNITSSSLTLAPIQPFTHYTFRVGAYTSAGRGPWSSKFHGRSFKAPQPGQKEVSIVWGTEEGLVQTDTTGDNLETLVHTDLLRDLNTALFVTTVAWFKDMLYFSTNSSKTMWFNTTTKEHGLVAGVDSAGSIAIDWLGKRLYWSNPKQSLIKRCGLNGEDPEPLPIFEVAKEIHVDSLNAYIYWSTSYSVSSTRLNGGNKTVYYPATLFSGKQVMGISLDIERSVIFWIVRSNDGSLLYRAPMSLNDQQIISPSVIEPEKVISIANPIVQGPLCYFSDHLLWLQDSNVAVISDTNGEGAAIISDTRLSGLYVVAIIDRSTQQHPSNETNIEVIPSAVSQSSIRFEGTSHNVSLVWEPVSNINYGKVFYDVKIINNYTKKDYFFDTSSSFVNLGLITPSYSPMKVIIRAYTYWGSAPREAPLILRSPVATPTAPMDLRAFVSYSKTSPVSTITSVVVTVRWKIPLEPNGVIGSYRLRICNELDTTNYDDADDEDCKNITLKSDGLEYTLNHLLTDSQYNLQIWARTEAGEGNGSDIVWLDTSIEKPVPQLLLVKKDEIAVLDMDLSEMSHTIPLRDSVSAVTYLASEGVVFWLSKEGREISSCTLNCTISTKIYQLLNPGSNLVVDWIARKLYWSEQLITENHIWALNLQSMKAAKLLVRPGAISGLQVSPLSNKIFWVEDNGKNVDIMQSSLSDLLPTSFLLNDSSCSCPKTYLPGRPLAMDSSSDKIIWTDELIGDIWSADLDGCNCKIVASQNLTRGLIVSSLASDMNYAYWLIARDGSVFSSLKNSFGEYSEDNYAPVPLNEKVNLLLAIGSHLQPYPDPECLKLTPEMAPLVTPKQLLVSADSLTLSMPSLEISADENCGKSSQPTPHYHVYYYHTSCMDDEPASCDVESLDECKYMGTFEPKLTINNLEPFSCYGVFLAVRNFYTETLQEPPIFGSPQIFKTREGAPSEARDVQLKLLSPWSIGVSWLPPLEIRSLSVKYDLLWSTDGMGFSPRQFGEVPVDNSKQYGARITAAVDKLAPNQLYLIKVRTYSKSDRMLQSESLPLEVKTLPEPKDIELVKAGANVLHVSWSNALPESVARFMNIRYAMQFAKLGGNIWETINESDPGLFTAKHLVPKTSYQFRVQLWYSENGSPVTWPQDSRFSYETLVDRPSAPGTPYVQILTLSEQQVLWEPSKSNGADIEMYILEGKAVENQIPSTSASKMQNEEWTLLYNSTENHWLVRGLMPSTKYIFRVQAYNAFGYSNWSHSSNMFDTAESARLSEGNASQYTGFFSLGIPIFTLCLCTILVVSIFICVCPKKGNKSLPDPMVPISRLNPDVELATLRETPRGSSGLPVMQHTNTMYMSSYTLSESAGDSTEENLLSSGDLEIAALQHIRRDQIKLTCFLGSGAFGEVYEGEAKELPGGQEKVAVKTLKKGATEHEKKEFLKEAQLMSNFRHEHILQMLGVCLDKESNFIVMELMEGGDLLNFLRTSRPLTRSGEMTLIDLVSMAVDVARGCRYLEELRYVHRDLACRNCLVSFSGSNRVVKIGDFGLARDVYKNDYYRKESEGLLPVRWMSPESLLDRVFTTQSDVWAFGVIMWEILTMGQQPYPARTNQEVFNYVSEGGRLNRPINCPDEMNSMMVRCWHTNPKSRPTFKNCLDILEELKVKVEENPALLIMSDTFGDPSVDGQSNLHHPSVVYLPPESRSSSAASTDTNKYLRVVTPAHSTEFDPTKDSDGYVTPCMLPAGLQSIINKPLVAEERPPEEHVVKINCSVLND